jgi:hypothetical protein
MILRVLDPTNEMRVQGIQPAARPSSLQGKTIGIISNGKEGTKGYFAHLDSLLRAKFGAAEIIHHTKSNYSAPADAYIVTEIANWDAIVTGIGD